LTSVFNPNIFLIAFATADEAIKVSFKASFGVILGRNIIENHIPPFGEIHRLPSLPFPCVCVLARITILSSLLFSAISLAMSFVEDTLS